MKRIGATYIWPVQEDICGSHAFIMKIKLQLLKTGGVILTERNCINHNYEPENYFSLILN